MTTRSFRASSLPVIAECGQAAHHDAIDVGLNASLPGRNGDAFHAFMAQAIATEEGRLDVEGLLTTVTNVHAAERDEVRFMVHWAMDHWRDLKEHFPDPICEVELEAPLPGYTLDADTGKPIGNYYRLTGHPDVLSLFPEKRRAHVLDYKSGRRPGDHHNQLRGYAYLIFANEPDIDTVWVAQLDVRTGRLLPVEMSRAECEEWARYFVRRLDDNQYRPGDHCDKCHRKATCPALPAYLHQMIAAFIGQNEVTLPEDKAEWGPFLFKYHGEAKTLEGWLRTFFDGLKATLSVTGPLTLPSGEQWGIAKKPRESFDAAKSADTVKSELGIDALELMKGMKLTKKQITEFCAMRAAAHGGTAKEINKTKRDLENRLLGLLRAVGACETTESNYVEVL